MEFKHWYGVVEKDEREFNCGILVKEHESSFFAERGGLLDGRVLNTIVGFRAKKSLTAVFFTSVSLPEEMYIVVSQSKL